MRLWIRGRGYMRAKYNWMNIGAKYFARFE